VLKSKHWCSFLIHTLTKNKLLKIILKTVACIKKTFKGQRMTVWRFLVKSEHILDLKKKTYGNFSSKPMWANAEISVCWMGSFGVWGTYPNYIIDESTETFCLMHHTSISCRMQCTAIFSNEPTELITGYNSVFGAYNSLQDWVTTHVVKANLFRSTMNLWILVLKLKCLSRTHSESFSYSVSA